MSFHNFRDDVDKEFKHPQQVLDVVASIETDLVAYTGEFAYLFTDVYICAELTAAIVRSKTLKSIVIYTDNYRYLGAIVAFARGIKHSTTLEQLIIRSYNAMDNSIAKLFADAIASCVTLTIIVFDFPVTDEIVLNAFGDAIGRSKSLKQVHFGSITTTLDSLTAIARGIKQSKTMKFIFFEDGRYHYCLREAVIESDSFCLDRYVRLPCIRVLRWLFEDYKEMIDEMKFLGVDFL